jgi:hypothetical protein
MAKCMQCGGMKKAKVGTVVDNEPSDREIKKAMRKVNQMDREDKRWNRRYDRQQRKEEIKNNKKQAEELMKSDRFKKGGITQNIVGMPGYNATTRPTTMKNGGAKLTKRGEGGIQKMKYVPGGNKTKADQATVMNPNIYAALGGSSTPVQTGCPPGTARLSNGGCGTRERFGG